MKRLYLIQLFCFMALALHMDVDAATKADNVLATIAERCRESQSESLLISHHGKLIFEYRSPSCIKPLDSGAITQSIAGLAIAFLIQDRLIESYNVPVNHFYPEWNQEGKNCITLRHLLTQTSGLRPACDSGELNKILDIIQYALCADLITSPGCSFYINHKAVNLIGGIVEKASGRNIYDYLNEKLFKPLGIKEVIWLCDPTQHEYCMAHLMMNPRDLLKIGEFIAQGGMYEGCRLLKSHLIFDITQNKDACNPYYGLLWYLNYNLTQNSCNEEIHIGSLKSLSSYGENGEQLIVFPHQGIVAVRLVADNCTGSKSEDRFDNLEWLLEQYVESIGL